MSNLTITSSEDFNKGNHKVAFDYILLKSKEHALVGEKVEIKTIAEIAKMDSCQADQQICFMVELADGRMFEAHAKPQVYAKLSVGSDPVLSYQNPVVTGTGVERGTSVFTRVVNKVVDAIQCGACNS